MTNKTKIPSEADTTTFGQHVFYKLKSKAWKFPKVVLESCIFSPTIYVCIVQPFPYMYGFFCLFVLFFVSFFPMAELDLRKSVMWHILYSKNGTFLCGGCVEDTFHLYWSSFPLMCVFLIVLHFFIFINCLHVVPLCYLPLASL